MSIARRHRDKILAGLSVAKAPENGAGTVALAVVHLTAGEAKPRNAAADRAAQQIGLRLTHDLRDLKAIRSIDAKIEAKRQRIGEYRSWITGLIEADAGIGTGTAAEVAPTIMVWLIDLGEYSDALLIANFLIRHNAPMPARYNRDAASVMTEEIAQAAIKAQAANQEFDLDVLREVDCLIDGIDMHDEIRAKLNKALGSEMLRQGEALPAEDAADVLASAQAYLAEAHRLNDRVGVKDRLKRVAKLIAATAAAAEAAATENADAATITDPTELSATEAPASDA